MARHYATRDFFRQIPNHLLARYFHARGVFDDLDIAALPEPQPDALWAVWLTLDDTQRHAMDAAFQDIAALSGEKGYRAILDDAAWHFATDPAAHAAFVEQLASLAHHGARAMTTFLDHPACWRRATRFFHAEALPAWRKRTHLPHVPAVVDEASLEALAAGISTYFRRTEGRGTHCVVEPVRRGTLDYFFAYPEDYASPGSWRLPAQHPVQPEAMQRQGFVQPFRQTAGRGLVPVLQLAVERLERTQRLGVRRAVVGALEALAP